MNQIARYHISGESDDLKITVTNENNSITININNTAITNFTKEESSVSFKHFDINAYYHENEGYNPDKNELVIIYTRNIVYYYYNRGFTSNVIKDTDIYSNFITMPDANGKLGNDVFDYYLPANTSDALLDPTTWTTPASKGDVFKEGDIEVVAYNKLTSSMSRLFKYNVPLISYNYMQSANVYKNISGTDPLKAVEDFCLYHVVSWGESINYQTSCQKGNLKLFKEYFNVCAISFIPVAIFEFILGFFLQYTVFIYFLIVLQIGVYIFYLYRINTQKISDEGPTIISNQTLSVEDSSVVKEEKVEEVKEVKEEENPNMIG